MSKQNFDFIDYLVSTMPLIIIGKGHPNPDKCLYAMPDNISTVLYDYVESVNLEKTSAAFVELRDNVTPGRILSLPFSGFIAGLCSTKSKIYAYDDIDWQKDVSQWKQPSNNPSVAELNNAKLTFINYLVAKIPTVEIYQASGTVLGVPKASFDIIEDLVNEYNIGSLIYKNLCSIIGSKIIVLDENVFMTHLETQEIKSMSACIEDFINESNVFGEINAAHFNLIQETLDVIDSDFLAFNSLSDRVATGEVKLVEDYH